MSAAPAGADQQAAAPRGKTERRFFVGMGLAAALTVFAGFAPSYFLRGKFGLKPPAVSPLLDDAGLTPLLHLHGLIFTAWIALFIVSSIIGSILMAALPFFLSMLWGLVSLLIWIAGLILWIMLMVKAYSGQKWVLPIIGPLAEKQA